MAVNPEAHGTIGGPDDAPAIQAAMNSISSRGGTVELQDNKLYKALTPLTIPRGVTLRGSTSMNGQMGANNAAGVAAWNTRGGLVCAPNAPITMKGSSALEDLAIRNLSLTYPTADDTSFTGTAVQINGEDDASIQDCAIIGFDRAVNAFGAQRGRIERLNIDCTHGVQVEGAYDIWYLRECHAWPFSNIVGGDIRRRGVAYRFLNGGDWNKMTDCFSYGYARGAYISNCNSMTLAGCGFDNVPGQPTRDSIGILLDGNCEETSIEHCQIAASQRGLVLNLASGRTMINGLKAWANSQAGMVVMTNKPVNIANSVIRNTPNRILNPGGAVITQTNVF